MNLLKKLFSRNPKSGSPEETRVPVELEPLYARYASLDVSRDTNFERLFGMLNSDEEFADLARRAESRLILGGSDTPEGYSGTCLSYDREQGLRIYDWIGVCEIPDDEKNVPATDENMKKYFWSSPHDLKTSILDYIKRGGRWKTSA